jgi:microcystin-dependent protein
MPVLGVPEGTPSGTIAIWTGSIATIPDGWKLCDGTLGTPDLRNRYPKCVPNGVTNPGTTGGEATVLLTIPTMPSHNHDFDVPNHEHDGQDNAEATTGSSVTLPLTGSPISSFEIDISSTHLVGSITSVGGDVPHNNLPRSKDVLYIQKS